MKIIFDGLISSVGDEYFGSISSIRDDNQPLGMIINHKIKVSRDAADDAFNPWGA
jgi:hypothetical protein